MVCPSIVYGFIQIQQNVCDNRQRRQLGCFRGLNSGALVEGFQKINRRVRRIPKTFQLRFVQTQEFIDFGLAIGEELYEVIQREFSGH